MQDAQRAESELNLLKPRLVDAESQSQWHYVWSGALCTPGIAKIRISQ